MSAWRQRYLRWLDRRIPRSQSVHLTQRNLFIFLSRHGLYFLLLDALIWIGATNFQNNLAYALAFLLLAVVFVAILQTCANLSGLRLRFISADPVFAGEVMYAKLELHAVSTLQHLVLQWPGQWPVSASVIAGETKQVLLPVDTQQRGLLSPGRFRIETVYPLGIVRCWSWLDLSVQGLVYPAPVAADYREFSQGDSEAEGDTVVAGGDEYFALKTYTEGEALSRIAWKQFAAGRGLLVREYADYRGGDITLNYSAMTDKDVELRLSKLCFCARQLHAEGRPFGLQLPGCPLIVAGTGDAHLRAVLTALALFPG
ncbi:MAG: DUF58 domain-containing protein [Pseudomonadales bacterium]|nr:DUF58 domain-containing protein [Pseudomonadales bacterium]